MTHHSQSLSVFVGKIFNACGGYLSVFFSVFVSMYQYLSVFVSICQYLSVFASICQYLPVFVSIYEEKFVMLAAGICLMGE